MCIEKFEIVQGYLDRSPNHTVRVRKKNHTCYLTIKGKSDGDSRLEIEYEIPIVDFNALLDLCEGKIISKTRYIVPYKGFTWEIDEFHGDLYPLMLAEIELSEHCSSYPLPEFIGDQVTGDIRFYNSNL